MSLQSHARIGRKIVGASLSGRRRPLFVQFALTNRCNKRCLYCDYPGRSQAELSTEEIRRILAELARLGCCRVNLLGGEPLLRDDIGEIVEAAVSLGLSCVMTSNGSLVPAKVGGIRKLSRMTLSLDGPAEENDRVRGAGSFAEVLGAVQALRRAKIDVQLSCVLSRHTCDSIERLLEEARRLSCAVAFNIPYQSPVNARGARAELASDAEYRRAIESIIDAKRKGAPVLFSKSTYKRTLRWPTYAVDRAPRDAAGFSGPRCYAGRRFAYIDTNGDFYPCVLFNGAPGFAPLNGVADGVEKAWEHCAGHACRFCFMPCYIEYNHLFGLQAETLWNEWRNNPAKTPA